MQGQIDVLEERLESVKLNLERINEEISTNTSKLEEIVAEMKKATFWNEFKKVWIDKWFVFVLVGFIGLIIGGFLGWSVFSFFDSIINAIKNALSSL